MISVAAAITSPLNNAVKHENSSRSLRTTLMAASPCGPWLIPKAQRTPLPWRKSDLVELWDWSAGSHDQCEQFNDAYSDHQHSKCYRVVLEPMRPLYIHRRPLSVPRFELLDECSDIWRDCRCESVILGPKAVPN